MILPRSPLACLSLIIAVLIVGWNYKTNGLGIAPQNFFETFQSNGQARVLGGIYAAQQGLDMQDAALGNLAPVNVAPDELGRVFSDVRTHQVIAVQSPLSEFQFEYYTAQYGLQAIIYGWVYDTFGLTSYDQLQWLPLSLTALCVVLLSLIYGRTYHAMFGILFFTSLAMTPWFVAIARNLYWNPFLLLLPAIFTGLAFNTRHKAAEAVLIGLAGVAVFLKCLSNYEYVTCVVVLACSIYIVGPHFRLGRMTPWRGIKRAVIVFCVCVLGFAGAFALHAAKRGDTITDGIKTIYEEDISRRTFGDGTGFEGETAESLEATVIDALQKLWTEYPEKRRMIIPGKVAKTMLALVLLGFAALLVLDRRKFPWADAWLFATYLAVPLSWFIAAKGHSYTQTHINYVLLYIGFFPALIYCFFSVGWKSGQIVLNRLTNQGQTQ